MRVEIEIGATQLQEKNADELLNLIGESVLALQNKIDYKHDFQTVFNEVFRTWDARKKRDCTEIYSESENSAKIAAIKRLRELTNWGLKLSKFTVEGWIASNWV